VVPAQAGRGAKRGERPKAAPKGRANRITQSLGFRL